MKERKAILTVISLSVLLAVWAVAGNLEPSGEVSPCEVIYVPDDYPTIQSAIHRAGEGCEIIVRPNTYDENINFMGKAITVRSEDGPDVTSIVGSDAGSIVTFDSGEVLTSVLDGFTISSGSGTEGEGGGVYCLQSSPTIVNCLISFNDAFYGAGVYCGENSSPAITNCTIDKNTCYSSMQSNIIGAGGGIYCDRNSSPTITGCSITGNIGQAEGGGIFCNNSSVIVSKCIISGNSAAMQLPGGVVLGSGGAISSSDSSVTIDRCIISGNDVNRFGGGVYFNSCTASISNSTVSGNAAGTGGGVYSYDSVVSINNCTFSGNQATYGGAMYNQGGTPTLTNCTLSGNTALSEGGCIYNNNSDPILTSSILWGNSVSGVYNEAGQIASNPGSTPLVNYCCVQGWTGGLGGTGNIGDDPEFVGPADNLRLSSDSPCIDKGDNTAVPSAVTSDLDGHLRIVDGDCNGTATVDMGAYEFNYAYMGDFDYDCEVNFGDFAVLAQNWQLDNPAIDIAPFANPDGVIDFKELSVIAVHWLDGVLP